MPSVSLVLRPRRRALCHAAEPLVHRKSMLKSVDSSMHGGISDFRKSSLFSCQRDTNRIQRINFGISLDQSFESGSVRSFSLS
jgi:hypothetical protein